jgi:hypothetical protein
LATASAADLQAADLHGSPYVRYQRLGCYASFAGSNAMVHELVNHQNTMDFKNVIIEYNIHHPM